VSNSAAFGTSLVEYGLDRANAYSEWFHLIKMKSAQMVKRKLTSWFATLAFLRYNPIPLEIIKTKLSCLSWMCMWRNVW